MRIGQVMQTPAVVCRPRTSIKEAARLMAANNVGSVLVVDRVGCLSGIVTDRDIALRAVGEGLSPDVAVSEVMTRDVAAADIHWDVDVVVEIMRKREVRRLPVVDSAGRVHGVVSTDDLLRKLRDDAEHLADTILAQDLGVRG